MDSSGEPYLVGLETPKSPLSRWSDWRLMATLIDSVDIFGAVTNFGLWPSLHTAADICAEIGAFTTIPGLSLPRYLVLTFRSSVLAPTPEARQALLARNRTPRELSLELSRE